MIVKPKTRGFICTTSHPVGCAQNVQQQIDYVQKQPQIQNGPKNVLVIGSSTGYGLASRIMASFGGSRAATIGVFFEKASDGKRTATSGWYNSAAFEKKAQEEGIYAKSFNGDAFSDEMKQNVMDAIKKDLGSIDLVIYSLAAPRRQHPKTGKVSKSVLKPIGKNFTSKTLNLSQMTIEDVTLTAANDDEIEQTVSVMGGEDWAFWIDGLMKENLLAKGAKTIAYSYIGPDITQDVYRKGTIGQAKDHLEATAKMLNQKLKELDGQALISVNKALVTQSSSAIPVIPLYFVLLNKVMKAKGLYEDCIMQIHRLFSTFLYTGQTVPCDGNGMIRLDDWETRDDVQGKVKEYWQILTNENLQDYADLEGYQSEFLQLFGFGFEKVDYDADVNIDVPLISESSSGIKS